MAKRKSTTSPSLARKKARLDLPTDTPSLKASRNDAATSSSASISTPTPQRREKRKRSDSASSNDLEESNPSTSAKRAKTQSPINETRHSRNTDAEPEPSWRDDPDFVPWPSPFDDPQSEAHIYYEDEHYTKELTPKAREFRKQATLAMHGYLLCPCGKYHQVVGRKCWHHPGMEPELEEPFGAQFQLDSSSAYRSQSQELLRSPEVSDDEETYATEDGQLEIAPNSASESSSISPDSQASLISETSNVSPSTSPATSPATSLTTSPVSSSTTTDTQGPRQRSNLKRSAGKQILKRQMRKKNKRKLEGESADKDNKRQPRGRRSKTTSAIEEQESLHSRRSSRRVAGSQLWSLDDNGKACLVTSSSR